MNDFISGGQVFTHKIHMLLQILHRSFFTACGLSIVVTLLLAYSPSQKLDHLAIFTYVKAKIVRQAEALMVELNPKQVEPNFKITANTKLWTFSKMLKPKQILQHILFQKAYAEGLKFLKIQIGYFVCIFSVVMLIIYLFWARLGRDLTQNKHIAGTTIRTFTEVNRRLKQLKQRSQFKVGPMYLVKDSETKHFLITGTTGSGKTNLLHLLLPQIRQLQQPALVVDQTGEMIAKYYDKARGDIIFNPLDQRAHTWDFWRDNSNILGSAAELNPRLEKLAKVLFSYGKKTQQATDPFWDNSAMIVFCAGVEYLMQQEKTSMFHLKHLLTTSDYKTLSLALENSQASRYFTECSQTVTGSILAVMTAATKPLWLLNDQEPRFSLQEYFSQVKQGSKAWLFLSSPPDLREVTLPLLACLFELSISYLIGLGIDPKFRFWFILDELASLGRLNSLATLLSEGRKYGACVLSATQSVNQLFEAFGSYGANHLIAQFATKFLFRTDDPTSAKLITELFGDLEYSQQQKNTSFGASEFREGISYTQQQRKKALISAADLAGLSNHECFISLPEPKVKIAKIKLPLATNKDREPGFILAEQKGLYQNMEVNLSTPAEKILLQPEMGLPKHEPALQQA